MCEYKDKLKKENEELRNIANSIVKIVNAKVQDSAGVYKRIIHKSGDVIVQMTNINANSFNEVESTPFDSDIFIVDGDIDIKLDKDSFSLNKKKKSIRVPRGSHIRGIAKKDSALVTVIDISEDEDK